MLQVPFSLYSAFGPVAGMQKVDNLACAAAAATTAAATAVILTLQFRGLVREGPLRQGRHEMSRDQPHHYLALSA